LGCAYLNFTASHDGIGMRPAEGILPPEEAEKMIDGVRRFGGEVSMRTLPGGGEAPYELNITWFDAMAGSFDGPDDWHMARFLCSQTIIMALEGIPAFYIHALLATPNDHEGVAKTGIKRAINRHRWDYPALLERLADPESAQSRVLNGLKARVRTRCRQPAFHPNATQFTLHLDPRIFGIWRQSLDRDQSIFALHNVSRDEIAVPPLSINLIGGETWVDLLSGEAIAPSGDDIVMRPYQCRWITNRARVRK
ncbi:MAG: alpha-amylase, partial [Paracoccaceae bacterium]